MESINVDQLLVSKSEGDRRTAGTRSKIVGLMLVAAATSVVLTTTIAAVESAQVPDGVWAAQNAQATTSQSDSRFWIDRRDR